MQAMAFGLWCAFQSPHSLLHYSLLPLTALYIPSLSAVGKSLASFALTVSPCTTPHACEGSRVRDSYRAVQVKARVVVTGKVARHTYTDTKEPCHTQARTESSSLHGDGWRGLASAGAGGDAGEPPAGVGVPGGDDGGVRGHEARSPADRKSVV